MRYAISAWFDEGAEKQIRDVWKSFHEQSVDFTFHSGPYRPHITLAIFETSDIQKFSEQARTSILQPGNFQLRVSSVGFFIQPSVLFLSCAASQPLNLLHSSVHSVLANLSIRSPEYYLPEQWTPHISLSTNLPREKFLKGVALLQGLKLPLTVNVNRLGVIEENTKIELEEISL